VNAELEPALPERQVLRIRGIKVSIERLTYMTVILMSVLVVYDGWGDLTTFAGIAAVVVAPVLATAIAHAFSEALDLIAHQRRPLRAHEWRHVLADQVHLLLVAVPPLLVLGLGFITPLDPRGTVAVMLWTGFATLVVLTALAAWRAGLRGWRLLAAGAAGGLLGLVVIALQVVLKPS
jgi:hypothetical protein